MMKKYIIGKSWLDISNMVVFYLQTQWQRTICRYIVSSYSAIKRIMPSQHKAQLLSRKTKKIFDWYNKPG